MQVVTISELKIEMNWKSRNSYYTHVNNGTLKDCYVDGSNNKKLYLEKVKEAIAKISARDTRKHNKKSTKESTNKEKIQQSKEPLKNHEDLDTIENREELKTLIEDAQNSMQKVTIAKDFWTGKINEQKFKKEAGELMSIPEVKEVLDKILTPFNRHYDEMPIIIRSHIPDVSDEIVEWIKKYNDENKLIFSEL